MTNATDFSAAVLAANKLFMETYKTGNAAAMAALYTESGQFLPPGGDFVTGREAILALFQGFMNSGVKAINVETVEAEGFGDTGIEIGRYTLAVDGGQVIDRGKYIVVWKREGSTWKLHRDIINTSMPSLKT